MRSVPLQRLRRQDARAAADWDVHCRLRLCVSLRGVGRVGRDDRATHVARTSRRHRRHRHSWSHLFGRRCWRQWTGDQWRTRGVSALRAAHCAHFLRWLKALVRRKELGDALARRQRDAATRSFIISSFVSARMMRREGETHGLQRIELLAHAQEALRERRARKQRRRRRCTWDVHRSHLKTLRRRFGRVSRQSSMVYATSCDVWRSSSFTLVLPGSSETPLLSTNPSALGQDRAARHVLYPMDRSFECVTWRCGSRIRGSMTSLSSCRSCSTSIARESGDRIRCFRDASFA